MRYLAALLLVVSTWAHAQSQTTGNLIYSTTNPAPPGADYSWSGFQVTDSGGGGLSGGHVPGYNPALGQFMFGYTQGTIAYTMAVNSALSGTGIQISGIKYGLQYFNQDYSRGTLSTTVTLRGNGNNTLESYYHNLPQTTEGWTNFDQTKTFASTYSLTNIGSVSMTFIGQDDRYWAGYYGPQFRNQYLQLMYTVDQCTANPLSSPDCTGYAAAYFTQQCTISALYNPSCPGYAAAYYTQQCTINPLYDPGCPGYQTAYFNQQCELDGLYSKDCANYGKAYAQKYLLTTNTTTTVTDTAATPKTDPVSVATTSTTTSTTSPTSVTSVTSVISGGTSATTTVTTSPSATQSTTTTSPATAQETKKSESEVKSATAGSSGAAAKARAETRAQEVAKAAEKSATLEAQAATQGLVVGLMAFVPGFDQYQQAQITDALAQQVARQYHRPPVDNQRVLRQMNQASDRLHADMVDQQYR